MQLEARIVQRILIIYAAPIQKLQTFHVHDHRDSVGGEDLIPSAGGVYPHGALHTSAAAFLDEQAQALAPRRGALSEEGFQMIDGARGEGNHGSGSRDLAWPDEPRGAAF